MNSVAQVFTLTALLLLSGNALSTSLSEPSSSSSSFTSSSSSSSSSSSLQYGGGREQYHIPHPEEGRVEEDEEEEAIKRKKEEEEEDLWASMSLTGVGGVDAPPQNNTEVLAQVGGGATFTCHTHHLSDEMVTWLKRDDDQLLTVGSQVYAAENRFTATHSHHNKAWELWVKDVQLSDAGQYECQLTTHPPVTFHFTLKVTQAEAVVSGPSEVHIEEGSKLALECHVRYAASPPVYIFWYHNSTMVNYARQNSLEVQHHNYTSNLVVTQVRATDAGTYTCEPHLATPANVTVHVFKGKTPAAMQHGRNQVEGGASTLSPASLSHLSAALLLLLLLTRAPLTPTPMTTYRL